MSIFLREPTENDEDEVLRMCEELKTCCDPYPFEGCINLKVVLDLSYQRWLKQCESDKRIKDLFPTALNTINYLLVDEKNHIYGISQLRPELNTESMKIGGNISYAIRPSERKKGYATLQIKLLVEKARELGLDKILVTCRENNIGSYKAIINCNGIEDEPTNSRFPNIKERRFWINTH